MAIAKDPGGADFRPITATHWSIVNAASGGAGEAKQLALAALLARYRPALVSHLVCNKRLVADRAEDLVQGFLAKRVLEQDLIARAERERGKFRTFLLTALDRYAANVFRDDRALKRAPAGVEALEVSPGAAGAANPEPTPDEAFEMAWARQVLAEAVRRTHLECQRRGREDFWSVFEGRVLAPTMEGAEPVPTAELVRRLGLESDQEVSNLLVNAKRLFVQALRSVVGEYEREPEQIEAEIADLQATLARAGR